MKNKRIKMYIIILFIVLLLLGVGYFIFNKYKQKNNITNLKEMTPQEELSNEELRKTLVVLYFLNPEKYNLEKEVRQIDAKELVNNPYSVLIDLLIKGPKNEKLLKLIPDNTKLNNAFIKNNILYIDFSNDFINGQKLGKEQEELIIKSIVNTVTELTEINSVNILIDGKENQQFPDGEVKFDKIFNKL